MDKEPCPQPGRSEWALHCHALVTLLSWTLVFGVCTVYNLVRWYERRMLQHHATPPHPCITVHFPHTHTACECTV